jgi:FKBP-type peptidyl-prolyl cis-trans isomerase
LHKIGEDSNKANTGDYITCDITYSTINDSVFFDGRRKLQILKPKFKGSIDECFTVLAEGDSATFIISADDFFTKTLEKTLPDFISPLSKMKVSLHIVEIQKEKEYKKEKEAFLHWIEDFGDYEKIILQQYLENEKIPVKPAESGLMQLIIKKGNDKKIKHGDTVIVHFEGRFLNGKFFDSTKKRNEPFKFVYGTEYQVIKGLEEGIGMMSEGERSLFILPSELAFGTSGSSTGIIPPFTSLIFEVEILRVN